MGFARVLGRLAEERKPFSVATVVRTVGSSLGKPGFRMVVSHDLEIVYGTLGGACPDGPIVQMAKEVMETGKPRLVRVYLEDVASAVEATVKSQSRDEIHVETNCGGMMEIYVEPFLPPDRLIIIGEGGRDPVEDHLVQMAKTLGFEVVVIDHRPVLSTEPHVLIDEMDYDLRRFDFDERDSVVLLTRGAHDMEYLTSLSKAKVRYVGLMASKKRVEQTLKELEEAGVDPSFLKELRAPIGVDIGARTPSELALSILAEVVATKYGRRLPRKGEARVTEAAAG